MELKVSIKSVYGVETVYPLCPRSKTFATIAGTKTLTRETCSHILKLGYTFTVCTNAINLNLSTF